MPRSAKTDLALAVMDAMIDDDFHLSCVIFDGRRLRALLR